LSKQNFIETCALLQPLFSWLWNLHGRFEISVQNKKLLFGLKCKDENFLFSILRKSFPLIVAIPYFFEKGGKN